MFIGAAIGISLAVDHWLAWLLAVWFVGFMQFTLSEAVLHETSHYKLFSSRKLHHRLQFLYAWPFLQTMGDFQAEHLAHHRYLMSDKDQTKIDCQIYGLGKPKPNLFFIWFIKPFSLFPSCFFIRHGNAALDHANWLVLGLFGGR